ncbi:MAG: hypothetical protein KDJ16_14705 [Hyphomicrobiales bacterium]|nr:hypothetical protein [Hyphomicrobiales bacterium]
MVVMVLRVALAIFIALVVTTAGVASPAIAHVAHLTASKTSDHDHDRAGEHGEPDSPHHVNDCCHDGTGHGAASCHGDIPALIADSPSLDRPITAVPSQRKQDLPFFVVAEIPHEPPRV